MAGVKELGYGTQYIHVLHMKLQCCNSIILWWELKKILRIELQIYLVTACGENANIHCPAFHSYQTKTWDQKIQHWFHLQFWGSKHTHTSHLAQLWWCALPHYQISISLVRQLREFDGKQVHTWMLDFSTQIERNQAELILSHQKKTLRSSPWIVQELGKLFTTLKTVLFRKREWKIDVHFSDWSSDQTKWCNRWPGGVASCMRE